MGYKPIFDLRLDTLLDDSSINATHEFLLDVFKQKLFLVGFGSSPNGDIEFCVRGTKPQLIGFLAAYEGRELVGENEGEELWEEYEHTVTLVA